MFIQLNNRKIHSTLFYLDPKYFHNSHIISSKQETEKLADVQPVTDPIDVLKNLEVPLAKPGEDILINFKLPPAKPGKDIKPTEVVESVEPTMDSISSYAESFPWLEYIDSRTLETIKLSLNTKVNTLPEAVQIINKYLEARLAVKTEGISETKLSEFLKPFTDSTQEITVKDLYNHIRTIYDKDPEFIKKLTLSNQTKLEWNNLEKPTETSQIETLTKEKPLGEWGEMTVNEVFIKLRELDWETILLNHKMVIHALPLAANMVIYGFVLGSFYRYVHLQPAPSYIKGEELLKYNHRKQLKLGFFALFMAPAMIYSFKYSSHSLSDIFTIEMGTTKEIASSSSNTISPNSLWLGLFKHIPIFLIPFLVAFFIIFLFIIIFGFDTFLIIINTPFYMKLLISSMCIILILYDFLSLYLIYMFHKSDIKISIFFPNFIIKWLEGFKETSADKGAILAFRDLYYTNITIYLFVLILIVLTFFY